MIGNSTLDDPAGTITVDGTPTPSAFSVTVSSTAAAATRATVPVVGSPATTTSGGVTDATHGWRGTSISYPKVGYRVRPSKITEVCRNESAGNRVSVNASWTDRCPHASDFSLTNVPLVQNFSRSGVPVPTGWSRVMVMPTVTFSLAGSRWATASRSIVSPSRNAWLTDLDAVSRRFPRVAVAV